jgi:K+-transporting ATPase A subunit
MTAIGWAQIALYCVIIVALTKPLGGYMTRVFTGERTLLGVVLSPIENQLVRLAGVDARMDRHWTGYAFAMLLFNALGFLFLFGLQRLQDVLPLNPQGFAGVAPDLAFNTAVSFVTNTNWQSYSGESTNVFGRMVSDQRQGWAILAAMGVLFLAGVAVAYWAEAHANPALAALGVDPAGGNMEGKEVRFGVPLSALFAVITTAASCGAVIAMHDSFLPVGA